MSNCGVCGSTVDISTIFCASAPYQGKPLLMHRCPDCGFMYFPENMGDYLEQLQSNPVEQVFKQLRNANEQRPGREFWMASMGFEIIGKQGEVTFFGSGLNTDHQWVKRIYPEAKTKLVDLNNLQNVENFEPIDAATKSDIVIASEVIEHFDQPRAHFETLLNIVKDDGLLVCSTNIYDGTDITRDPYPFTKGHCAYWTPLSLLQLAGSYGFLVDFRTPEIGATRAGPRKKYILIYKQENIDVMLGISHFFGTHMYAPSEKE